MSKPIEYTENNEEREESIIPEEYREGFLNLLETVKNLNDSGMLSMINAIAANYPFIIDSISEQFDTDTSKNLFTNIAEIVSIMAKINPDKVSNYLGNIGKSINDTDINKQESGLMNIMRLLNNKETSRTIAAMLSILSEISGRK